MIYYSLMTCNNNENEEDWAVTGGNQCNQNETMHLDNARQIGDLASKQSKVIVPIAIFYVYSKDIKCVKSLQCVNVQNECDV